MDPLDPFLFLVGGTLVSMLLQLFAESFVFIMVWEEEVFLVPLFRAIFAGSVTGIFVSSVFPLAQPFVALVITTLLMLPKFHLSSGQRLILVLLNVFFAFGPPVIRLASGI